MNRSFNIWALMLLFLLSCNDTKQEKKKGIFQGETSKNPAGTGTLETLKTTLTRNGAEPVRPENLLDSFFEDKNLKAFDTIKSIRYTGVLNNMGAYTDFEYYVNGQHQFYLYYIQYGDTISTVFNGEQLINRNPFSSDKTYTSENPCRNTLISFYGELKGTIFHLTKKFNYQNDTIRQEIAGGEKFIVLEGHSDNAEAIKVFFNFQTLKPEKAEVTYGCFPSSKIMFKFGRYKRAGGILVPFVQENSMGKNSFMRFKIKDVEFNKPVSKWVFRKMPTGDKKTKQ